MNLCYCFTCKKYINSQGIARHRAMHRDKKEYCKIQFSGGETYSYHYDKSEEEYQKLVKFQSIMS